MEDKTDQLSRRRYILVGLIAISYLIGEVASLSFMSDLTGLSDSAIRWIENITLGLMMLLVLIGGWMYMTTKKRDTATFDALNDELTYHHARMAAIFTFKFIFALSFFLIIATKIMVLDAVDIARTVFAACLVVSYLRFAYLEFKHA